MRYWSLRCPVCLGDHLRREFSPSGWDRFKCLGDGCKAKFEVFAHRFVAEEEAVSRLRAGEGVPDPRKEYQRLESGLKPVAPVRSERVEGA